MATKYPFFSHGVARRSDEPFEVRAPYDGAVVGLAYRAIFRAFERLDVGGVIVGDVPTYRADYMPYGGVKESGQGREGIRYAIEKMTERKVMVLNLAPPR